MSKFVFKIWREKSTVCMRIISQPEDTRNSGILFEHDGLEIKSYSHPELLLNGIYLRGFDSSKDNYTARLSFDSIDRAKRYQKAASAALRAYAATINAPIVDEGEAEKKAEDTGKLKYRFDRIGAVVVASPINIPAWAVNYGTHYKEGIEIFTGAGEARITTAFLKLPGPGQLQQSSRTFNDEEEAKEWIERASKAIAECNRQHEKKRETEDFKVPIETTIAE